MTWTYDNFDLSTTSDTGRLNSVRLLIGDTDTTDQLVQDEEIIFALGENNDDVYLASSWLCRVISAKFARLVDTQLDGVLEAKYGQRAKQYALLAVQMESLGRKSSGRALGVSAGGISKTVMEAVDADPDRPVPAFRMGQFDNPDTSE